MVAVSWTPPPTGFVKINTDGNKRTDGTAGAASVIRNSNKKWIAGTTRRLFGVGVKMTELWAIFDGLMLCWNMGYKHVVLESDAQEVINLLKNPDSQPSSRTNLLSFCRDLLQKDWDLVMQLVFREANRFVDWLAKSAKDQTAIFKIHVNPPVCLNHLLDFDYVGRATSCCVPLNS